MADNPLALDSDVLWHLADPSSLILHNAWIGKGTVTTASVIAQMPGMDGAGTLYGIVRGKSEKESIWETARQDIAPSAPSRVNAFFAFLRRDHAERAKSEWFGADERLLLRVRVPPQLATIHIGDAKWLDAPAADWPEMARRYWRGEATDDARPEVIIHGHVHFPDWERPPFGLLGR